MVWEAGTLQVSGKLLLILVNLISQEDFMLVIGSKALEYHGIKFDHRDFNPNEIDLICTEDEHNLLLNKAEKIIIQQGNKPIAPVINGVIHDCEIVKPGSVAEVLWETFCGDSSHVVEYYMEPQWIYFLKMSHRFLKNSPHFYKTMQDIRAMREMGIGFPKDPIVKQLFKQREEETYTYNHPNLKQNKSNFFETPGVEYKYDHDSLHEAVAIYGDPAYTYYKEDKAEVYCSEEKFNLCPLTIRLAGVVEESMVLALERCLVPYDWNTEPSEAFRMALEKVCTSITSGWFREFSWENYEESLEMFDNIGGAIYIRSRFYEGVKQGIIQEI